MLCKQYTYVAAMSNHSFYSGINLKQRLSFQSLKSVLPNTPVFTIKFANFKDDNVVVN